MNLLERLLEAQERLSKIISVYTEKKPLNTEEHIKSGEAIASTLLEYLCFIMAADVIYRLGASSDKLKFLRMYSEATDEFVVQVKSRAASIWESVASTGSSVLKKDKGPDIDDIVKDL